MQFTDDEMNFLRTQHPLAWAQVNVIRMEREAKELNSIIKEQQETIQGLKAQVMALSPVEADVTI